MSRPKKYSARTLKKAVDTYFDSITRDVELTERVDTGKRDRQGHAIYETRAVTNRLGKPVRVTEYVVPPSVKDLCDYLGVNRSTWAEYAKAEKNPELACIAQEVYERMKAWNERELLTRTGKNVRGIIFNLQNNYGYGRRDGGSGIGEEAVSLDSFLKAVRPTKEEVEALYAEEDG